MKLSLRRGKLTLQIEPTNACNLNCPICMRHRQEKTESFLSLVDFCKILDSTACRYVGIHGWGEPLLNEQLFMMVEYAESRGVFANLTTNGILLGKRMDEVFQSGLRDIAFGICKRSLFEKIVPDIYELIKERNRKMLKKPRVYLDITVYKEIIDQMPRIVRLASKIKVDAIILHRLFNVYGVDPSAEYITSQEEEHLFTEIIKLSKMLNIRLFLPLKKSIPCEMLKRCVFVTATGDVSPCTFLPGIVMGNALESGVNNIMNSPPFVKFVKNMKQHPICSKCHWSKASSPYK